MCGSARQSSKLRVSSLHKGADMNAINRPATDEATLSGRNFLAASGALVLSFWMDWSTDESEVRDGLQRDVVGDRQTRRFRGQVSVTKPAAAGNMSDRSVDGATLAFWH